ncbi:MAG TPA: response regulator [Candidatus Nitrosocosmicus sp.]|nr:response regulator [Candidatus Nitrosocosmicus sp.]
MNSLNRHNTTDPQNKHHIVIIDDEVDLLMVYKRALEMSGLVVSAFADPLNALDEFRANHSKYHLVITDIRMPNMNGYKLINQIKKINPTVKIIFVTAQQVSKSDIMANLDNEVSFDEFIIKPVSLDMLNKVVQSVINSP